MGKDFHLNSIINRFGFNKRKKVGDITELISRAMPLHLQEWEEFYYKNGRSKEVIENIGKDIYKKLIDVILPEIKTITEVDCIDYIKSLVIEKSFDGMRTRFEILKQDLLRETKKEYRFLPDHKEDWRFKTFCIDYYHLDKEKDLLIGLKVCPYTIKLSQNPIVVEALDNIKRAHKDAENKDAGYFFIIFYTGSKKDVRIENNEIWDEIKNL